MNADERRSDLNGISQKVIGCAYSVANAPGVGFLEKVYENALAHEVRKAGLEVRQQHCIKVEYDGVVVGDFAADLIVEGCILVELKTARALDDIHFAQCMNYLRATSFRVCLLMNFGSPRLEIRRLVNKF